MNYIKFFYWLFCLSALTFNPLVFSASLPPVPTDQLNHWDRPNRQHSKGQLISYCFTSRILKNKRDVWVYIPFSYEWKEGPYPLLIVFDGQAYTSQLIPGPTILDNLIALGKIPPLVAVFISSVDQPTRNLELPCYSRFVESLTQELVPWVSRRYFVTKDPSLTIVAGSSYGGLAAAYAAFRFPQRFGNVLSQSGAFWWNPSKDSSVPWLVKQFEAAPAVPVHFYMDVGDQETSSTDQQMSMVDINRHLHQILDQKGCQVTYYEFKGGHDYDCWRKTFAIGLMVLLGNKGLKPVTNLE